MGTKNNMCMLKEELDTVPVAGCLNKAQVAAMTAPLSVDEIKEVFFAG